jgi:uncharacterized OsmC-like protein
MDTAVTSNPVRKAFDELAAAITVDPRFAANRFSADSDLIGVCEVDVRVGGRTLKVDEPARLGGLDTAPNPMEYALASLGACQAITYRYWSERLGVRIDRLRVEVRGEQDVRGVFGFESVRAGFGRVDVEVLLRGPEPPERYEALREAVDRHCPLLDLFASPVPVRTRLSLG